MIRGLIITIMFCLVVFPQLCFANLSLSVNPVDGSNSLRFERTPMARTENKEEIHIRVNSTNGNRYQVFQRILEPIMNDKGDSLNLQSVGSQTLSNSNSYGTLYLQNSDHMSMSDQLLYSSSQSGQSDSFTIGYSLDQGLINASGRFRGRLVFSVRGIGNDSSDQMTIDVTVETPSTTISNLNISIKGSRNPTQISVQGSNTSESTADYLTISFSGNTGQTINIYQQVGTFLQNNIDQQLGPSVLQLESQGNTGGLRMVGPTTLNPARTLVYSSNNASDSFLIYFMVNADQIQQQAAGTYNGQITYSVETPQGTQQFPINVQCNIPAIFSMSITPPPGGISFTHVLANSPPQDKQVTVTVSSNLQKPYQVVQDLQTSMVNQQGKEFNGKYFTVQVYIPSDQKGQTNLADFTPVQIGEYPIFSSDSRGSGATFQVVYRLQGYTQMNAGNFSAPIRFSLNQK